MFYSFHLYWNMFSFCSFVSKLFIIGERVDEWIKMIRREKKEKEKRTFLMISEKSFNVSVVRYLISHHFIKFYFSITRTHTTTPIHTTFILQQSLETVSSFTFYFYLCLYRFVIIVKLFCVILRVNFILNQIFSFWLEVVTHHFVWLVLFL